MLLRSVNAQIGLPVLPADAGILSVVYDGPVLEAAYVFGRASFVSLVGGVALNLVAGMQVVRVGQLGIAYQSRIPIQVTGDRWFVDMVGLFDLVRGDEIRLFAGQFTAGRVALAAEGFWVAIR